MVKLAQSILIVTSNKSASGVVALTNAASGLGVELKVISFDDFDSIKQIDAATNLIFRLGPISYPHYKQLLPKLAQGKGYEVLKAVLHSFDKVEIADTFRKTAVPHPDSWVLKKGDIPVNFPVIIKIRNGNKGKGVGLLKSLSDYLRFVDEFPDETDYLLQEYILGAEQDKRLIIVGDKLISAMKRTSAANDFRANLHAGGSAELYEPTAEEIRLAVKATQVFKLQYAGVDIIDSPKGPLVLEVNPSPGFAISKITNRDVAKEVIEGVINA